MPSRRIESDRLAGGIERVVVARADILGGEEVVRRLAADLADDGLLLVEGKHPSLQAENGLALLRRHFPHVLIFAEVGHPHPYLCAASKQPIDKVTLRRALALVDQGHAKVPEEDEGVPRQAGSTPRIASIIPVFNGRRFLREAVESVLRQTLAPAELLIVDDGSTDRSLAAIEGLSAPFPIEIIRQPNAGQSAARNRAVERTTCDFIALLDQDDQWLPCHLEYLAEPFKNKPWLGWTYSNIDEIDEEGHLVRIGVLDQLTIQHPIRAVWEMLRCNMHILPTAAMIRREAFLAIGGFDEGLSGYEDDDLFLRLFRRGFRSEYLPESTAEWRVWAESSAHSPRMVHSERAYAKKLVDEFAASSYVPQFIAPRFFYNALDRYQRAAERADWEGCSEARADALHFLAMMSPTAKLRWKTRIMAQPRLHAAVASILRRMPDRIRRALALQH